MERHTKFQVMVHFKPVAEDNYAPRTMELVTRSYDMASQTFSGAINLPNVGAVFLGAVPNACDSSQEEVQEASAPPGPPPSPQRPFEQQQQQQPRLPQLQRRKRGDEREPVEKRQRAMPEIVADSPVVRDNATIVKELCRRIEAITAKWPIPDNRGEYMGDGPLEDEEEYHSLMAELRALQARPPPSFDPRA